MRIGRVRWPWILVALVASGTVALITSGAHLAEDGSVDGELVAFLFLPVLYAGLGAVLATRAPGNRIAWLLLLVGSGFLIEGAADHRVGAVPPADPNVWDVVSITWLNTGFFFALVLPLAVLVYIFPTGRFLSRRWAWAGWAAAVSALSLFTAEAFALEIGPDDGTGDGSLWTIPNPVGFLDHPGGEDAGLLSILGGVPLVAVLLMSVPAIVVRYRRSSADVRSQIKWVVLALLLVSVMFFSRIVLDLRFGTADYLMPVALAALPLSMTIAIIRYRLFDIDRLISRAISYAIVVGLLGVVFAAGVVWLPTALDLGDSSLLVAASTLAVAALFNPLRRRIQRLVDRRFNRSAYQAEIVSEEFATKLRDPLSTQEITDLWNETVQAAMQPQASGIWLKETSTRP